MEYKNLIVLFITALCGKYFHPFLNRTEEPNSVTETTTAVDGSGNSPKGGVYTFLTLSVLVREGTVFMCLYFVYKK